MKTFEFYGVMVPQSNVYYGTAGQEHLHTQAYLTVEDAEKHLSDLSGRYLAGARVVKIVGKFEDDAVFEVTQNSDMTEGRGTMQRVALFSDFLAAVEIARGRGVMGVGNGDINLLSNSKQVFSTAQEFRDTSSARRRTSSSKVDLMGYFGLNKKYFQVIEDVAETRRQADPEYAEYMRLRERFER